MKNKVIKITILILMTLLTIGVLSSFSYTEGKSYGHLNLGGFEAKYMKNDWRIPTNGSPYLYCIEPGALMDYTSTIPYSEALAEVGKQYTAGCWCAAEPKAGRITYAQYKTSGSSSLSPSIAYIVTDSPSGYTKEKQKGIYHSKNLYTKDGRRADWNLLVGNGHSSHDDGAPTKYDTEAIDYGNFMIDIKNNNNKMGQSNNTQKNKVYTKVDQTTKKYTVGPFNVSYINGTYGGITFGGMTGVEVICYNKDGQKVNRTVTVEKFVINNREITPSYFTPDADKIDRTAQSYPKSGQDFEIVFSDPNSGVAENDAANRVTKICVKVKFQYMKATGQYVSYVGNKYKVAYSHEHYNHHTHMCHHYTTNSNGDTVHSGCHPYDCYSCRTTGYLQTIHQQTLATMDGERELIDDEIIIGSAKDLFDISMDLGGYVWEDGLGDKEVRPDGLNNTGSMDKAIPNVRVVLYTSKGTKIDEKRTDDEGCYLFTDLDSMKKYYVAFEYNGQLYVPTQYSRDTGKYNTEEWKHTSKATEISKERTDFDKRFAEIGAYPYNYKRANGKYNKAYSHYELMGFKLNEKGNYEYDDTQHYADGFYEIKDGNIVVSDKLNKAQVTRGKQNADEQKLNFVDDCKIFAYTRAQDAKSHDLYPIYDKFIVNKNSDQKYTTGKQAREMKFDTKDVVVAGKTYKAIYSGQFFIDLGLIRRSEVDLALRKDILYATTKINGKAEIYKYDKRDQDSESLWKIEHRMRNYVDYYGGMYVNGIYNSDYQYRGKQTNGGSNLEAYITYKITIRNVSQNTLGEITEVVDYYDKDYTYVEELSWVKYKTNSNDEISAVKEQDYHDMILKNDLSKIPNAKPISSSTQSSIYDGRDKQGEPEVAKEQRDINTKMNVVYVKGLAGKKLAVGEQAYIYLTFKVNKNGTNPITLDTKDSLKMNYAEINGYKTYYTDGTVLPNDIKKSSQDPAGIIDMNSTPGNLRLADITGNKYEKNFENDTDRAKGLQIKIDENAERKINGTVWEDQRTKTVGEAVIGDGVRNLDEKGNNSEIVIQGVTVQLVEKLDNGEEFLWQTTTTSKEGTYEFSKFVPGNYVVRFMYGHNDSTVLTTNNGGANNVSYNGQDFKSTVYQKEMNGNEISKYTDTYYDIKASDAFGKNLSDAKDIWENIKVTINQSEGPLTDYKDSTKHIYNDKNAKQEITIQGRESVINYSNKNLKNHRAEVLTSPYAKISLKDELIKNTQMIAQTGVVVIEGEYNRQSTIGDNSSKDKGDNNKDEYKFDNHLNGNYTINNLDFGLTERPKAQLELNKQVTNVKVTLANESVLFDAEDAVANLAWIRHTDYNVISKMKNGKYDEFYDDSKSNPTYNRYSGKTDINKIVTDTNSGGRNGLIQITMDSELMHGAKIQISYKLTVKNVGETDYTGKDFYYKATGASEGNIVTTTADLLVDYVANNLQYRMADNNGWTATNTEQLISSSDVDSTLKDSLDKYNTIIETNKLNKALKPGEETSGDLILTQTITSQNTDDDMNYQNIAEILQTSNSVGRRMAYSVVGNQDPTKDIAEIDSARAENVLILPPFGNTYLYFGLGIAVIVLIAGAVIFIKKKILVK